VRSRPPGAYMIGRRPLTAASRTPFHVVSPITVRQGSPSCVRAPAPLWVPRSRSSAHSVLWAASAPAFANGPAHKDQVCYCLCVGHIRVGPCWSGAISGSILRRGADGRRSDRYCSAATKRLCPPLDATALPRPGVNVDQSLTGRRYPQPNGSWRLVLLNLSWSAGRGLSSFGRPSSPRHQQAPLLSWSGCWRSRGGRGGVGGGGARVEGG